VDGASPGMLLGHQKAAVFVAPRDHQGSAEVDAASEPTSTAAISLAGRTHTAQHRPDVFERQAGHWAEVLEYLMESCGEEL